MFPHTSTGLLSGMFLVLVLNAILGQFNQELGAGMVPIPPAYHWLVPILGAALTAVLTALTPSVDAVLHQLGLRSDLPAPDAADPSAVVKPPPPPK